MKRYILWSLLMLQATNLMANQIEVIVDNIDIKRGGEIRVYLFSEKGFPKVHEDALQLQSKQAIEKSMRFIFTLDESIKELAIKLYHDENSDGKVSKNWTGIYPSEGLGFSNNQTLGVFGPPSYKSSKLTKDKFLNPINISIIYP